MSLLAAVRGVDPGQGQSSTRWAALGTEAEIRVDAAVVTAAAQRAREVLDEVDRACSRFRPDSDLNRVNAHPGEPIPVSPVLIGALRVALEAARQTGGLVDPTMGPVLQALGYDRAFDLVPTESAGPADLPVHRPSWRDVVVTEDTVTVPRPCLDLGATGKAFAADLLALTLHREFPGSILVNLGGDLRAITRAEHPAYEVTIDHTLTAAARAAERGHRHLALRQGGLATSSTAARRWQRAGQSRHHLLDPRSGRPTTGPWRTVTALGATSAAANTASTAALVLGEHALSWLTTRGIAARLIGLDGHVTTTPTWPVSVAEGAHP